MLGLVPTWGNIVVYITSYFRKYDDSINLQDTFIVFPLTLICGSLLMQVGSVMLDYCHPKIHLLIGGSFFVFAIFVSTFIKNYYFFLFMYAIVGGFGYGIVYILPLKSAYSYFPNKKGLVGGIILSCYGFAGIGWSFLCAFLVNPHNEAASLYLTIGSST